MRKKQTLLICSILLFLLVSCASTKVMLEDSIISATEISLEEKLDYLNFPQVEVGKPEIIYDGEDWAERLTQEINNSQSYILITSFLASECEEDKEVYEALCRKAEEGVKVYFICDSTSSMDMTESKHHLRPIYYLADSNVKFFEFNSLSFNRIVDALGMFMREHRKLVVIDGHTVALGGMNINYISTNSSAKKNGQRDCMYIFNSASLASVITEQYTEFWNKYSVEKITEDFVSVEKEKPETTYKAWFINQTADNIQMPQLYGSLFSSAEHEILILPFLPLMNKDMLTLINKTSSRGVDLELILPNEPRKSNNRASHYSVLSIIENGMKVRQEISKDETSQLLHEKLMIIDNRYVVIGSVNFNYRTLVLSQEVGLVIDSPELAGLLKTHYMELRQNTQEVTPEEAQEWHNLKYFFNFAMSFVTG